MVLNKLLSHISFFILLISGILLLSGCPNYYCQVEHMPFLPYKLYPKTDSIHIGDTLWLESQTGIYCENCLDGKIYNYQNVEFFSGFYIQQEIDKEKDGYDQSYMLEKFNFSFIKGVGYINKKKTGYGISYLKSDDSFLFKVAIIPKDTGLFRIQLTYNSLDLSVNIDVGDNNCRHYMTTTCQSINEGDSTLGRAINKGFKFKEYTFPTNSKNWESSDRAYFFNVIE